LGNSLRLVRTFFITIKGRNITPKIKSINALKILDFRGQSNDSDVYYAGQRHYGFGFYPLSASTSENEAVELRDGDQSCYTGKEEIKTVANVNNVIAPKIMDMFPSMHTEINHLMI
jgi:enolase